MGHVPYTVDGGENRVIQRRRSDHPRVTAMLRAEATQPPQDLSSPETASSSAARQRALVTGNLRFVWRALWSRGVPREDIDDAVQQVFLLATRKLDSIEPGRERAFLFGVATNVAHEWRRAEQRAQHRFEDVDVDDRDRPSAPDLDEMLERKRARELLDRALTQLPEEQRLVFVLFELEGLKVREIAQALELPKGTVASRLRLGREAFRRIVQRQMAKQGGAP